MRRSMRLRQPVIILLATLIAAAAYGCAKTTRPGPLHEVRPVSDRPRAGNAYLVRGFIGIFSGGVDNISDELNRLGIRAHVYQDDQWPALARRIKRQYRHAPDAEPLVLIGHSYGADDVIRIARELDAANVPVDLLVTLDPVTPRAVPKNVRHALNIYQSNGMWDKLPFLRGVAVKTDAQFTGQLQNFDIRKDRRDLLETGTDHFNIDKKSKVHEEVVGYVLMACPPRATWVAERGRLRQPAGAAAARLASTPPGPEAPGTDTAPPRSSPPAADAAQQAGHRLGN